MKSIVDTFREYERHAVPRCYECGRRGHLHLRCPGVTTADEPPNEEEAVCQNQWDRYRPLGA